MPLRRKRSPKTAVQPLRVLDVNLTAADIQKLGRAELMAVREHLGLGGDWNNLVLAEDWFPPGSAQTCTRTSMRSKLDAPGRRRADLDLALLRANQFVILCFVTAASSLRGTRMLSVTTVVRALGDFLVLVTLALNRPATTQDRLFDRLQKEDFDSHALLTVARRLRKFAAQDLWADTVDLANDYSLERSRRGKKKAVMEPKTPEPFLPLPDEFIGQAGWRMVWIARTLGPALIECAQGVAARFEECEDAFLKWKRITNKKAMRGKKPVGTVTEIGNYILQFQWRQPDGTLLTELPFRMLSPSRRGQDMCWPPRSYSEVKELLKVLQTAHLFIFLLSTGGRISETLSLQAGCIVESPEGIYTANGKTYKLVFDNAGATRDWPLPEMALHAISQQEVLSVALTAIGRMDLAHAQKRGRQTTSSIWKSVGFQGKGFKASYNHSMRRTMDVLNLSEWMDDDPLSAHRFRKTIARLIALAMVGAPKILMDLFGHKSIEMTLHYILTDPGIRSEMAEVAQAQIIMLATDVVREAENLGGPAAAAVRGALADERVRLGADFGEEDLRRLAETLTFGGRVWQLVRPGVICTKGPQQSGPCNRSLGHPEPSRCRSSCGHRLEQAFLREDTDRALAQAVGFLEVAQAEEDSIAVEMWHGQILAHLPRFPDLAQKWRSHPAVARLEAL